MRLGGSAWSFRRVVSTTLCVGVSLCGVTTRSEPPPPRMWFPLLLYGIIHLHVAPNNIQSFLGKMCRIFRCRIFVANLCFCGHVWKYLSQTIVLRHLCYVENMHPQKIFLQNTHETFDRKINLLHCICWTMKIFGFSWGRADVAYHEWASCWSMKINSTKCLLKAIRENYIVPSKTHTNLTWPKYYH